MYFYFFNTIKKILRILKDISKKTLKEYKKTFVWFGFSSILILIITIPSLINEIYKLGYKIKNLYFTLWEAKDVLSFYGSFLSFLGTVILGALALWQNKKSNDINKDLLTLNKETERKSVLPFLSFNQYIPCFNGDLFKYILILSTTEDKSKDKEDKEYSLSREDKLINEFNWIISENKINICRKLTDEQLEKIKCNCRIETKEGSTSIYIQDQLYKKICVQNCGRNSVINVSCRLYKEGFEKNENLDKSSIPLGRTIDMDIYIDLKNKFKGKYILQFIYYDIYIQINIDKNYQYI